MGENEKIIAYADKTVMMISGLEVKGLNTEQLEDILIEELNSVVRVIGVTGDSVEMDVYGIDPENIRRDSNGIIKAVACADGITLTELANISSADRIYPVEFSEIKEKQSVYCPREKWRRDA